MPDHQRVRRLDGFFQGPFLADPGDLPDGGRGVEEGQGREQSLEGGRERFVRGRQGCEGGVATAGFGDLQNPEKRGGWYVGCERLVYVP